MLILRPYKPCDANTIVNWCTDAETFRKWCSDRYATFPITPSDMNNKYLDWNGDCVETDNFYPLTAVDEHKTPVGHLIMRYINGDPETIRFGFVIVDNEKRGQGLGKEMLLLAIKYAFEILKAKKISIGVFDSNTSAYRCYLSCGFKHVIIDEDDSYSFNGQIWNVLELELTLEDYQQHLSRMNIFSEHEKRKSPFDKSDAILIG